MKRSFKKIGLVVDCRGAVLIEILLALAIGSAVLTAICHTLVGSQQASRHSYQGQQAEFYLAEAKAAVIDIWRQGWAGVDLEGVYHPEVDGGDWQLLAGQEDLGIFSRQIVVEPVWRDDSGRIASEAGTQDPAVKRFTTTVRWQSVRPSSVSQSFLLSRWQDNLTWTEDSGSDFIDGVEDATDVTTNPGYIQLAQTGGGGWTEPGSIGTVDGESKAAGIWATDNYIYLTQDQFLAGVEVFNIQDSPATPSSMGSFGLGFRPKGCAISGDYLYIASGFPTIEIYDLSTDPVDPDYLGSDGILYAAEGIWATDSHLFIAASNWPIIVVYQLDNGHWEDPDYLGFFFTTEDVQDIAISGNYIYVAQESTSQAVEIYDCSTSVVDPDHVGTVTTLYQPTGVWTESNILYLSMDQKRGAMYSISSPTDPQLFGYFPTERNSADIAAFGDYGYVAGADSQHKVIEVFDLADSKGVSGIYFVYGEYLSSTFEATQPAAFNRLDWQADEPAGTDVLFQVATNDDGTTWNYLGPDGTEASYFEQPGSFPLSSLLGRYLRYKAILTGDSNTTPVIDWVEVNYSP